MAPQVFGFCYRELKHEIPWKSLEISIDGAIDRLSLHFVKQCQIPIEHHFFAANQVNSFFNSLAGDEVYVANCEFLS